jgi:hypothetical protein
MVLSNKLLACNTQYHSNFAVHEAQRTYYPGVPEFIEVGEHQFVEQVLVRMWTTNLLLGLFVPLNLNKSFSISVFAGIL